MGKRIYFDTNVIVDLFDAQRPFHAYSVDLFRTLFRDETVDVFINTDTLTNLFYILRSHVKLDFDTAIEKLEFITHAFTVVSSQRDDIDHTIELCKKHIFKDYEDGMQYVCALKEDCTLIITNNPKDFKNATIEVISSQALSESW